MGSRKGRPPHQGKLLVGGLTLFGTQWPPVRWRDEVLIQDQRLANPPTTATMTGTVAATTATAATEAAEATTAEAIRALSTASTRTASTTSTTIAA